MDDSTSSIPANLTEDDDRKVFVSRIPNFGAGIAINDRLLRASR